MRIRTINEAAAWVKETDPNTALTPTAIRRLVISGEIPSRRAGAKYLLDLDTLEHFMSGTVQKPATPAPGCGEIRPVR
jgi:hypothetical protein